MLAAHEHVCPDIADHRRTGADRHPGDRGSALACIADRRRGARPDDPGRDDPFLAGLEAGRLRGYFHSGLADNQRTRVGRASGDGCSALARIKGRKERDENPGLPDFIVAFPVFDRRRMTNFGVAIRICCRTVWQKPASK